jgi:hypothetical protein
LIGHLIDRCDCALWNHVQHVVKKRFLIYGLNKKKNFYKNFMAVMI